MAFGTGFFGGVPFGTQIGSKVAGTGADGLTLTASATASLAATAAQTITLTSSALGVVVKPATASNTATLTAAAAGVVERAVSNGGWNGGMGNHITILHDNGTVTYYGHLMTLFVKAGDKVDAGDRIGLMGGKPGMAGAGNSTGCHVHFQVAGATNWLTVYPYHVKSVLKY